MIKLVAATLFIIFLSTTTASLLQQFSFCKAGVEIVDIDDTEDDAIKSFFIAKLKLNSIEYSFLKELYTPIKYYNHRFYKYPYPFCLKNIIPPELS